MRKYKYKILNLDCANCAKEVEEYLNKQQELTKVNVNYNKQTIIFETDYEGNIKEFITKLVKNIEPDVNILPEDEDNDNNLIYLRIIKLIIGIIIGINGITFNINTLLIISYIFLLAEVFIKAFKVLIKSRIINENLLITISCIGAYFTGHIHEGLMVIALYEIGKILEQLAVNNSRKSISKLMNIKPEYANLKKADEITKIDPSEVKINDIIIVKKGEKIPLDGIIVKGNTLLNTSTLTGESKLQKVKLKDQVYSGSINEEKIIEIKVTKDYENSTVSRILNLVENATEKKAKTETFANSFAKYYTPIVILLSILIIFLLPLITPLNYQESLYRSLTFLVISCPCAIAISVPLSYFTGIGVASKNGILIKGSNYLDSLKNITKIIFDKTGTITLGNANNYNLEILNKKYSVLKVKEYFVKGEKLSNHPIAKSILNIFKVKTTTKDIKSFKEIPGKGIRYKINNNLYYIGSSTFVKAKEKDHKIYLKINNSIIARLELIDGIKQEAKETINKLQQLGIKTMMFTGDEKQIALKIAEKTNINEVKYELLPDDKYYLLKEEIIHNKGGRVAFIGDGINDAPSLALADIGISMGSIGSESAIEASDVVITNDNLLKIITAINISKKTTKIIKENLIFAIGTKILVLILSVFGFASMWQAVFADTGVTLITILNTLRILNVYNK